MENNENETKNDGVVKNKIVFQVKFWIEINFG